MLWGVERQFMAKRIRTKKISEQQAAQFQRWYADPSNAACRKAQAKEARQRSLDRNRKFLQDFKKTAKCIQCGESHPACLDFHHEDPTTKNGNISKMVAKMLSLKKIKAEIAKCTILCKNCHAKLHYNEKIK